MALFCPGLHVPLLEGIKMWSLIFCLTFSLVTVEAKQEWTKNRKNPDVIKFQNSGSNDFVETVHVIFMNHLDVGYADLANNIINEYFQKYFPRAVAIGSGLERGGYVEKFKYTTHPWLVTMYLDCPPNLILSGIRLQCPSDEQKAAFINGVKKGYISWHAGTMNLQTETAEPWLYEFGFDISQQLDERFNITRLHRAVSQRDVPGMTIAAVTSMKRKGIIGVSVGVNNMTPPPAVPTLFNWQFGTDSVIGTWHPGGYPDNQGPNPAHPGGLSRRDCAVVKGFKHALCFAFRTDNSGPPESVGEVLGAYEILRAEFPNAQLLASNLETYFEAALSIKDQLPIVTNEIGDTWIQGASSDPRKSAEYRALSRVMRKCIEAGKCSLSDPRVWNSSRLLAKIPEHTLGLYSEHDEIHWSNPSFYPIRKTAPNFINIVNSWVEQRNFTYLAIDALQDHAVVKDIQVAFSELTPKSPDLTDFEPISDLDRTFSCPSGNIKALQFGSDGSIVKLNYNDIEWADKQHSLSSFVYDTFDEKDFDDFGRVYNYNDRSPGYSKPNVTKNAHPESKTWISNITSLFKNKGVECDFYVSIKMANRTSVTWYGAPDTIWVRYTVRKAGGNIPGIDLVFQWFDKTITRLPEALSLAFRPIPQTGYRWLLSKMDRLVDPTTVLLNGSQYQHVIWDQGVHYTPQDLKPFLCVRSPDVPLAMILTGNAASHIFPAPLEPFSEPITGVSFNIYNNIWETNFIMWYPYLDEDKDFRARFSLEFVSSPDK